MTYALPDGRVEVRVIRDGGIPCVFVLDPKAAPRRFAYLVGLAVAQDAHRLACRDAPSPFYPSAT